MPIIVRRDTANLSKNEVYRPEVNTNLLAAMAEYFEPDFGGLSTDIYLNGYKIISTDDGMTGHEMDNILNRDLCIFDEVVVINRQAGMDPITIAYIVIAAIALAAAIILAPDVPGTADAAGESPNNKLNAAQNEFRPNQAIPEIFGSPISYPDFIQPSYFTYENNLKVLREMFCIGVGEFEIRSVKSGETDLSEIPSSKYEIYEPNKWDGQYPPAPGTLPPQGYRVTARSTNEINDQALEALNSESYKAEVKPTSITADGQDSILNLEQDETAILDLLLVAGDYLDVDIRTLTDPPVAVLDGVYEILELDDVAKTIKLGATGGISDTNQTGGFITKTDSSGNPVNWVGWFTIPGKDNESVFFNVVMPSGVRSGGGGYLEVGVEMQIRQIDSSGSVIPGTEQTLNEKISGNTLDAQYRTWFFNQLNKGEYQGRLRRSTDESGGSAAERINVEQLVGVEQQEQPNYGDVTLLWVERKAETQGITGEQSKINVDLTRKLGTVGNPTLMPTRSFADAAYYTLVKSGKRPVATVDTDTLYGIYNGLSDPRLGYFDFTFDDANVGLAERIKVICNPARTIPYRSYQSWLFEREEKKPFPVKLYNRRNTIGEATQDFAQRLPSDKDSVALSYVTLPDNVEKTIYRRISNGQIRSDYQGDYPYEIKLSGCQEDFQAENRADLEIRRLLYSRVGVEFSAPYDGLDQNMFKRVTWVDMNDAAIFDGEVLDVFGDEYLTSELFEPEPGKTYYVQLTDTNGDLSQVVECQPLSYTKKGFMAAGISGAYTADDGDFEIGSRYMIAVDEDLKGSDFIMTELRPSGDDAVTITLASYNEKMFEMDV